jgi:hypothetical protein
MLAPSSLALLLPILTALPSTVRAAKAPVGGYCECVVSPPLSLPLGCHSLLFTSQTRSYLLGNMLTSRLMDL